MNDPQMLIELTTRIREALDLDVSATEGVFRDISLLGDDELYNIAKSIESYHKEVAMNYKQEYSQMLRYDIATKESAERSFEPLLQNF